MRGAGDVVGDLAALLWQPSGQPRVDPGFDNPGNSHNYYFVTVVFRIMHYGRNVCER